MTNIDLKALIKEIEEQDKKKKSLVDKYIKCLSINESDLTYIKNQCYLLKIKPSIFIVKKITELYSSGYKRDYELIFTTSEHTKIATIKMYDILLDSWLPSIPKDEFINLKWLGIEFEDDDSNKKGEE